MLTGSVAMGLFLPKTGIHTLIETNVRTFKLNPGELLFKLYQRLNNRKCEHSGTEKPPKKEAKKVRLK